MNFRLVAFLDTWELCASLVSRAHHFKTTDTSGLRHFNILWPADEDAETYQWRGNPARRKFPELDNALSRIMRLGQQLLPDQKIERGKVFFEMLEPGTALPWTFDDSAYARQFLRLHLPLRTNPACMMFAGIEAMNLLPGQLTLCGRALRSAVNLGETPRVHLCVDFRTKEPTE